MSHFNMKGNKRKGAIVEKRPFEETTMCSVIVGKFVYIII